MMDCFFIHLARPLLVLSFCFHYLLRRYSEVFCEVTVRDTVAEEPPTPAAAPTVPAGIAATPAVLALLEDHRRMLTEAG
jgi:hypothetical protein